MMKLPKQGESKRRRKDYKKVKNGGGKKRGEREDFI